jgi:hypothetical protein
MKETLGYGLHIIVSGLHIVVILTFSLLKQEFKNR